MVSRQNLPYGGTLLQLSNLKDVEPACKQYVSRRLPKQPVT